MNNLLNVNKILNDKDCQTLKKIFSNIKKLNNKEKIIVINSFLIIINSPKIDNISIDDMNVFMNLIKNEWHQSYLVFIENDKYYAKDRELKNIFYKYIIEQYYMTDFGIQLFAGKSSNENNTNRQLMFFDIIKNTGNISYLQKMKLFDKMSICFHEGIAHNIQDYMNNLQQNLSKKGDKVIWSDHNISIIEEESLLKRVNIICDRLNQELSNINKNKKSTLIPIISINENGLKNEYHSSFIKNDILKCHSVLLHANLKNKDLEEFKKLKHLFCMEESFFYNKIFYFIENDMVYDALKESILLLEFFLRNLMPKAGEIKVKYDQSIINTKKKDFDSFLDHIKKNQELWNKNDILLDTLYLKKEFSNYIDNSFGGIKKKSYLFHDLLMIASAESLITSSNKIFLQYTLLNDDEQGLNLRNEIFHALKNEYHYYEIEVKENMDMIFNLVIFYILSLIINIKQTNSFNNKL